MTPDFPYVQLPGAFRGFFRKASIWEGIDHILCVSGSRFNEEYRRFYYRDIQAIIVEKRARPGSIGLWILLIILILIAAISIAEKDPPYSWVALIILFVLLAIRLEIAVRRSCRCSIQTAVSRELLPSLIRRSAADAAIARLRTRISALQGELPSEIPPSEEETLTAVRPPDAGQPSPAAMLEEAAVLERRRAARLGVNLAVAALMVLLFNAATNFYFSSGNMHFSRTSVNWIGYSLIALGFIPIFLSLQQISWIPALKSLRAFLVAMIVLSGLRLAMSLFMATSTQFLFRQFGAGGFASFQRNYVNINASVQLALAAGGLLLIFAKWETYRRGEPSRS